MITHRRPFRLGTVAALFIVAALGGAHAKGQCSPSWNPGYEIPGIQGSVNAAVAFDDGTGTKLYIGGQINYAGATKIFGVARWTGSSWEAVGERFTSSNGLGNGKINTLAVFNGQLYAGGEFQLVGGVTVTGVAKWNGTSWEALTAAEHPLVGEQYGSGFAQPRVLALHVYQENLYIGGVFSYVNNTSDFDWVIAEAFVKYDGTSFSQPVAGAPLAGIPIAYPQVNALATFGGDLYVAGGYEQAGAAPNSAGIARIHDGAWSSVGSLGATDNPLTMSTFDADGAGPTPPVLVVGGFLHTVGIGLPGLPDGLPVQGIATWNGSAWATLADGLGEVSAIASYGPAGSPSLYAASFRNGPQNDYDALWRWNGAAWEHAPGGPFLSLSAWSGGTPTPGGYIGTLVSFDFDGAGPQGPSLIAGGGSFDAVGSTPATNLAKFNGSSWAPIKPGKSLWVSNSSALNSGSIVKLISGDEDGAGPRPRSIYAYGNFVTAGSTVVPGAIARLDGSTWSALANGPGAPSVAALFHTDGTGTHLYSISQIGAISRWDGAAWTLVSAPVPDEATYVRSAASFNNEIYIGGSFSSESTGVSSVGIKKWNGSQHTFLESADVPGAVNPYTFIDAIIGFNNAVYAGGTFVSVADGVTTMSGLARWDGTSWQMVGVSTNQVRALTVYQGQLYVGGFFSTIGTATSPGIARFNGSIWSNVDSGVTGSFPVAYSDVYALCVADDGTGEALLLGGKFETAGNVPNTRSVAKYFPATNTFAPLDIGITSESQTLAATPNGGPTSIASVGNFVLFAGVFNHAGPTASFNTAAWGCEPASCPADFDHSGTLAVQDIFDFLNAWFAGAAAADANHSGGLEVQDIFDFLNLWFAGC